MPKPKAKPKTRSGPSLSNAQRQANGQARLAGLWLPADLVATLDAYCKANGTTRTAVVTQALRLLLDS